LNKSVEIQDETIKDVINQMFKKVLIALDFSGPSMELFHSITDLRQLGLEELLLVHAIRVELGVEDGIHPVQKKFLEKVSREKERLEREGLLVNVETPIGAPAEEIKRLAAERGMDLILIGSVGEGSIVRELFLGSTVAEVIRIASVPVLVEKYIAVGEKMRRVPIFQEKLATVLLPTDFSASAEYVYAKMLELAESIQEVLLAHVLDRGETAAEIKTAENETASRLSGWEERFREKGLKARSLLAKGPASAQILSLAAQEKATLIALSRRGKGQIAELFVGSTAEQIVRRAGCPVLLFN